MELNDIFAYICGHLFGHRKFVPNTSPNKTVGGALGAIALTTPLVAIGAHFVWSGTALDTPVRLLGLGIIVSMVGQFGDLMLSSIKRDLGLKDTSKLIPGHGGILDRFDSLILVAPAVFHYVNYFVGFAVGQPQQIFSRLENLMEPWNLQPAHDTGLTPERTVSQRAARKRASRKPRASGLFFADAKLLRDRTSTDDRRPEKLPAHGPFVLAANHCSHLDALALGAALTPRHRERAFPIAAGDVFFQTKITSTFSAIMLNALPMWRKNCGPHALAALRGKLQEEKAIFIIFPEGGRSRNGLMMPFKHGLGMLVAETNVPSRAVRSCWNF